MHGQLVGASHYIARRAPESCHGCNKDQLVRTVIVYVLLSFHLFVKILELRRKPGSEIRIFEILVGMCMQMQKVVHTIFQ